MQPFWSSLLTGFHFLSGIVFLRIYYLSFAKKAINLWLRFSDFGTPEYPLGLTSYTLLREGQDIPDPIGYFYINPFPMVILLF